MQRLTHKIPLISGFIAVLFVGLVYAGGEDKPYTVKNGKVDEKTYIGWRTFVGNCARCHGETATGSSFAPSLFDRMKDMPQVAFEAVVINGLKGQVGVMPPFKGDGNVTPYMDELWAYLSAYVIDKAIPAGRPEEIGGGKEVPEYLRKKK
jgi:mono/diheme cytochrome c family protein